MTMRILPALDCACGSLRRAVRLMSVAYDEALRPLGLRATQFSVLQALMIAGEISQGRLGEILALDSTTLTRTLRVMVASGWVGKRAGRDGRERLLRLAPAGEALMALALPLWEKVQASMRKKMRQKFGAERWENLLQLTNVVIPEITQAVISTDKN